MAPVIRALRSEPGVFDCRVVATAQHRELLDQMLNFFEISADDDLDVMRANQGLAALTERLLARLDFLLAKEKPDWVLAQGDTTTVFVTALACFYRGIRFGHIEAGLRTGNKQFPYPEEMNRQLASRLADVHFAPTPSGRSNLLAEGIPEDRIVVCGNTVIDALLWARPRAGKCPVSLEAGNHLVLVTCHRRENFGEPMREVFGALVELSQRFPQVHILLPVHPNPNVSAAAQELLANRARIHLCAPMDYPRFVASMQSARLILTDSGGIQEEAPSLGVPVLVLRDETERPEAVEAGVVELVGPHHESILSACERLLLNDKAHSAMSRIENPYGDGQSAQRIIAWLAGNEFQPFVPHGKNDNAKS